MGPKALDADIQRSSSIDTLKKLTLENPDLQNVSYRTSLPLALYKGSLI